MTTLKRLTVAVATSGLVMGAAVLTSPAAHAAPSGDATVTVIHGIPNTPVNVFVNGKSTLKDFKPGTVTDPLKLPAGSYEIKVFPAENTAGTGTPVIAGSAKLTAGENVSLVANLTASGKPALTAFVNDTTAIAAGKARVVVRHTAAAPAVDVRVNGKVAFKGLTNPKSANATLPAGSIKADVTLAGTSTVAIGPAELNLKAGTETIVYAIGSAEQKTLALAVQTRTDLGAPPTGVPTGSSLVDQGEPAYVWALLGAGGLLILGGGAIGASRVSRSRRS
ncbi:MAG: DUF4397 domain-containing protein [Allobranchiibius sp.]